MEKLTEEALAAQYTFAELVDAMTIKYRAELVKAEDLGFSTELLPEPTASTYNLQIEELDFSQRTFNCLRRAWLLRLADLAFCSAGDLSNIRGLGKKSFREVVEKRKDFGVRSFSRQSIDRFREVGDKFKTFLEDLPLAERRPDLRPGSGLQTYGPYPGLYYHAIVMLPQYDFPDPFHFLADHGFLPPA